MTEVSHLSDGYRQRLDDDYGRLIANELDHDWRMSILYEQPGNRIEYVRLGSETADPRYKPILIIPGFSGGIVANAPLAAALAARGYDTILPDQNRTGLPVDPAGHYNPTYRQAVNISEVIAEEKLSNTPLNVVTHSYGSQIFDKLCKLATNNRWNCFTGSDVAMMAPAGINDQETPVAFMRRYARLMTAGKTMPKFRDGYWQFEAEMFAAGKQIVMANKLRTLLEGRDIIRRQVDMTGLLANGVGRIALVPFAEDVLFSGEILAESIRDRVDSDERITAFSPYSLEAFADGNRGGIGADHNDQQFNPERVANALVQFFTR